MNYGNVISYVLGGITRIPQIIQGIGYYFSGGLSKSINLLSINSTHLDMRNSQEKVYSAWIISFWISAILGICTIILGFLSANGWGILASILGIIPMLFGILLSLLLYSLFMYFGKKNESHWNMTLMKVVIVLYMIGVLFYVISFVLDVFGILKSIISIFQYFAMYKIIALLKSIISTLTPIVFILTTGIVLDGINQGNPTNYTNSNNFNNDFQNNYQNNYQNNNFNGDGLSGLGAVNDRQTTSVNIGNSNNFNQNPQNVQLYACPYCQKAVTFGQNPCPHCGNHLNW